LSQRGINLDGIKIIYEMRDKIEELQEKILSLQEEVSQEKNSTYQARKRHPPEL
jgi:hypothetical protein